MNYDWSLNASGGQPLGPSPQPPHQITPQNLYQTLRQLGTLGAHFVFEAEHHGNRHWLFVFSRLNGSKIVVRVQKQYQVPVHPEIVQNMVRREVYVLKKLEQIRFLYAPICLAFDISYSNPIRFPFLVLTWTEGERLIWTNHHPTLDLRIRVMNQLSRLQLELIDNSLESRAETAKYFYTRHIHDNMMVAPRGLPGAGGIPTQEDYWNQLSHLECILGSGHGDKTYAIAHNNITYENIIVDKDYNVECIVGWSHAGVYPLGQAAVLPRILTPDVNFRDFMEAQLTAEQAIDDKIQYRHWLNVWDLARTPAKQAMLTWQNGPDADFRAIYMLSLKHREVLSWVARHDWRPPYCPPFRDAPQPLPPPSPSPPALPEPRNPPLPTRAGQNVPAEYEPGREAEPSTQELRDMVLAFRNRFEDGKPALKREPED